MGFSYPVVLCLDGKLCLVLGQSREAGEKADALMAAGARVRRAAEFDAALLDGVFLVISALQTPGANAEVFAECERRGILVNSMDDPENCRFTLPSIHRQGDFVLAVSTSGACPALAVRVRERLAEQFGPEYGAFLDLCRGLRSRMAARWPSFAERRSVWYSLVDSDALRLFKEGRASEARALMESIAGREEPA